MLRESHTGVTQIFLLRKLLGMKTLLGPPFLQEIWVRAQGLEDQGRSKEIFRSDVNISNLASEIPAQLCCGNWSRSSLKCVGWIVQIIPRRYNTVICL